ncbi:hypothetical protein AMS68_004261 [Peltaster fructicola]|uniref:Mitochondrial import inner membrane translocase subunit TIM50 n=1 Tax=Peltaster fructicola TaxID=286661 RepID=A0A6H0XVI8_9PEZI|nr:hypothetical protein AMS68_004261 [Peltaster fructicola]
MLRQPVWRALRSHCASSGAAIPYSIRQPALRAYAISSKGRGQTTPTSSTKAKGPPTPSPYIPVARAPTSNPKTRDTGFPSSSQSDTSIPEQSTSSGIENQPSPAQGMRPQTGTASAQHPLSGAQAAQEPIAQEKDLDSAEGLREETQERQSGAENTTQPQQPLPDLRQGIPSTFDFEFGRGRQGGKENEQGNAEDGESVGKRGAEEDEYSRADFQTSIDRRRAAQLRYTYAVALGFCLFGGAYFARPFSGSEDVPAGLDSADVNGWAPGKMYRRVQARIGDRLGYYTEPSFPKLLPDVPLTQRPPFTLVLSLEDLMVHSAWDRAHGYRMAKRPGIDYFIRYLSPYYELVLFTSVPIAVADPVIKKLDPYHFIMWPLGREATKYEKGEFVKDLSYLNRDLKKTLIIDTVSGHVKNQPENAIVLPKWSGDPKDPNTNDLVALIPFLEYVATMSVDDVREVIRSFEGKHIPTEFARREAIARENFNKQLAAEQSKKPKMSLGAVFGGGLGIKADRAGGMMLNDGQSVAEGLSQGKMLSDQIREQGQKQYEFLEKQIREQGAQWLKDEEDEQKRLMDEQMKEMKKNPVGTLARWFGGAEPPKKE